MCFLKSSPYIDYVPARLTKGKVWYISYYVVDPSTGKMKRFRIKLNRIKNTRERLSAARAMISRLNEQLALGWNPIIEQIAPKSYCKMEEALDSFLKIKGKELEENSMRSYRSYVKILKEWLNENGYDCQMYVCAFTKAIALSFMDDIDEDDELSARTYNNYLRFFKTMFNWMHEKGYISANPFLDIKPKSKRLTKKIRRLMTDDEVSALFHYLSSYGHREYLAMCLLCYCCFMRPKEIALLKCKDIDLGRQLVFVSEKNAKNDNDSYRTIPDAMLPYIKTLDLSNPEAYLFSEHGDYSFRAGTRKVCSRQISRFWSDNVRHACHFGMDVQFYSLKDTGMTNMVNSGVPLSFVQQQADHSSIAVTSIYLGKQKTKANDRLKEVNIIR